MSTTLDPTRQLLNIKSNLLESAEAEVEALREENERLKQHIRDLNSDLEGTIKDCNEHHGEA